jgi:uncharacterized protein (TIGR03663 family)
MAQPAREEGASRSAAVNKETRPGGTILEINLPRTTVLFCLIFAAAVFVRFLNLDYMAFHHDESLYAKYCWNLYKGQGYEYDPMQHGPFTFHATAVFFFLFGDSDATCRAVPVVLSLIMILLVWALRRHPEMGPHGALLAVVLISFTPITLYFNRFFRHDTPFALFTMGVPVFYVLFHLSGKQRYLLLMAASFALMFCTKENAFVSTIIFLVFAALYGFNKLISQHKGRRSLAALFDAYPFVTKWIFFIGLWGVLFMVFVGQHMAGKRWWSTAQPQAVTPAGTLFFAFMFLTFIAICVVLWLVSHHYRTGRWEQERRFLGLPASFYRDSRTFVLSFVLFGAICLLLYTSFFRSNQGVMTHLVRGVKAVPEQGIGAFWKQGVEQTWLTGLRGLWNGSGKWFIYWHHQHSIARIKGAFLYYVPHLLLYEQLTVLLVLIALFKRLFREWSFFIVLGGYALLGVVANGIYQRLGIDSPLRQFLDEKLLITRESLFVFGDLILLIGILGFGTWLILLTLRDGRPLRAFLFTWTIFAFCIYSYLQEKIPWLNLHIVIPMHLVAALALKDLLEVQAPRWLKGLAWAGVLVLGALVFHNAVLLAYYNPDNAVEQAVYVQTHHDVLRCVQETKEIADYLGIGYDMPVGVEGHPTWPLSWYLRNYPVTWTAARGGDKPVLFTNWDDRDKHEYLQEDYVGRRYQLRAWWIPTTSEWLNPANLGSEWSNLRDYILYRKRWNPQPHPTMDRYGSVDFIMWVRRGLYEVNTWEMFSDPRWPNWYPTQKWKMPKLQKEAQRQIPRLQPKPRAVWGSLGDGPGQFKEPKGLTLDPAGNLFVCDAANHRLQKLGPDGTPLLTIGEKGEADGQFNFPTDLVVDENFILYVADSWNHRLQFFDARTGEHLRTVFKPGQFFAPKGIDLDPRTGELVVVNTGQHVVVRLDRSGKELKRWGGKGENNERGLFFEPVGVACTPDGFVYVADTANQRVQRFNPENGFVSAWDVIGWDEFYAEPALAVGPRGNVYFTDSSKHRLGIFLPDGTPAARWGFKGAAPGEFDTPRGICVGPDGKVYVGDSNNHRIQVFDPLPELPPADAGLKQGVTE